MIRLECFPAGEAARSGDSNPTAPLLTCLLQSGTLREQQRLAVWVGGNPCPLDGEGPQQVATWHCAVEEEMEIHLLQEWRTVKAWRGWWKGGSTLVHTGTLPLDVFCAGQPQPAGLTTAAAALDAARAPDQQNGMATGAAPTAALAWPAPGDAASHDRVSPDAAFPREPAREDDLWREEPREEERLDQDESDEAGNEGEDQERGGEGEREAEETEATETCPVSSAPEGNPPVALAVPPGTTVAAFHASSAWSPAMHEHILQQLAAVLAALPEQTLLVDFRRFPSTPRSAAARRSRATRSGPPALGCSREVLRTLYGACYWERGTAIVTSQHVERLADGRPRWFLRVNTQESAEGLHELVTALTRGCSLLLLDATATYTESIRAAVITELGQRVSNLTVGPCS